MNSYYVKGCKTHGGLCSYTVHDFKIAKLVKRRRKQAQKSNRRNR